MQATKRKKFTKVNNKSTRKKSTKPLPSKEEREVEKVLEKIKTKIYLMNELSKSDKIFAKWYIKSFISDNVVSDGNKLKYQRVWNIRTYSALTDFKNTLTSNKVKTLTEDERMIYILKAIFKLNQSLVKDKKGNYDSLVEDVSKYYRECFMSNNTKKKVLFKSSSIKLTVSFKNNLIVLEDRLNNKIYKRDILLEELNIFPNPRLASQYIK